MTLLTRPLEFLSEGETDFAGASFLPDEKPAALDALLEEVWKRRFTTFVAVSFEIEKAAPAACMKSGFRDAALDILTAPETQRRGLINDPAFRVWLALAMRALNEVLNGTSAGTRTLGVLVREFGPMVAGVRDRQGLPDDRKVPGTNIVVLGLDVDPIIARATPPTYVFRTVAKSGSRRTQYSYSTSFFRDVASVAFERIAHTWPDCFSSISQLVRILGYLPDGNFRSASASRYAGVIYLTARDNSILDLEETLVHEGGHQILYAICEANPILDDTGDPGTAKYQLPWSHQVRDLYGYYHAFFIYVLLAKYYQRVLDDTVNARPKNELQFAAQRQSHIVSGLLRANDDLRRAEGLSASGRELIENLEREVVDLERTHRAGRIGPATRNRNT
jgi:hypothetical protein